MFVHRGDDVSLPLRGKLYARDFARSSINGVVRLHNLSGENVWSISVLDRVQSHFLGKLGCF